MLFVICSDIYMNCVIFANMDKVFSLKEIKKYRKIEKKNTKKIMEFCRSGKVATVLHYWVYCTPHVFKSCPYRSWNKINGGQF